MVTQHRRTLSSYGLMTYAEAAAYLGIIWQTFANYVSAGRIRPIRRGIVDIKDVEAFRRRRDSARRPNVSGETPLK